MLFCDKLNFVSFFSFHSITHILTLCHNTFKFTSVRRSQSPPPPWSGQLWCQSTGRRRRREKQGEHFTQFGPSVPFSVRSGQRDPGPGQREQAHPIQVSRAEERRRERCKAALNKERKRKQGKKRRWGYNLRWRGVKKRQDVWELQEEEERSR